MAGAKAGISHACLFNMINILPLPCDYIFSLMNFTATYILKKYNSTVFTQEV